MSCNSYYCAGDHCRRTTHRVTVRMRERTYFYCVECGRRLEQRGEVQRKNGNGKANGSL